MGARSGGRGASAHRYAVILAGGVGTRFWPHSRRNRPKQFLTVQGKRSLLEDTLHRLRGTVPLQRTLVVAAAEFRPLIRRHLPQIPAANLVVEPAARGTAACLGLAARVIEERDPNAVMAVFPSDHVIAPVQKFKQALLIAYATADASRAFVTFGIAPSGPLTGFGYIEVGGVQRRRKPRVFAVRRFVEKPDAATARRYLRSRRYLWNSGMFVWRADVLREAIATHEPPLARVLDRMAGAASRRQRAAAERAFTRLRSVSIDVAIMEKAERVAVVEGEFEWNDVGTWAAMDGLWPLDAGGNATRGEVLQIDCRDTVASADRRMIAMLGVEDLIVVDTADAILVCPKSRAQDVRDIVRELARRRDRRH